MQKIINALAKLGKFKAAISFLALEIFALIAFSFGDSYVLYGSLSLALMVLLILFNIKEITVRGVSTVAFFIIPLALFALLSAIGIYSRAHIFYGDFSVADCVFVPLGLLPLAFCGYVLSLDKTFKLSTFLLVIYSALGILTLINFIVNMVNLGAFYPILYKGFSMYYAGERSEVTVDQFAYTLEGLKFIETKMSHYVLYPALLLTSSAALIFISPKKNLKLFITYCVFVAVSAIALIFVPSLLGLFAFIIVLVTDLLIFLFRRLKLPYNPLKYGIYVVIGLIGVVIFIMFLINQPWASGLASAFKSNSLLYRVFIGNRFVANYNPLLYDLFSDRFLGFFEVPDPSVKGQMNLGVLSGGFIFDTFMTSGVIGVIALLILLFLGFRAFKKYIPHNEDKETFPLLGFVVFFFVFSLAFNEGEYGIFYDIVKPIYMTGPFMISLFIMAYVYSKNDQYVVEKKEEHQVPKEEVITDENV